MKELKNYFINLFDPRLLVILLFLVAMCIAITIIFSKKVPEFKQYKTNIYIYLFLTVLVYAVIAFLGYSRLFEGKTLSEFVFYQICTLTLGFFSFKNSPTPDIVPPVPIPEIKISTSPSVSFQISGPVVAL